MTDRELISGCLKNESRYQKELFDKYSGILMTVCRRYFKHTDLAQDALQDAFVRIYSKLGSFKHQGSFEGWLKRIVVNVCLRKLQNENKKFNWGDLDHSPEYPVKSLAEAKVGEEELLSLIAKLPTGYRTVFNMYAMDGYSHKEIAVKLGITDSTSRSQLVKARNMLQKMLKELYEE